MNTNLVIGIGAVIVGLIGLIAAFLPTDGQDAPGVRVRRVVFQVIVYGLVPILAGGFFLAAGWDDGDATEDTTPPGR